MHRLFAYLLVLLWVPVVHAQGTERDRLIETARDKSGEVAPYVLTQVGLKKAQYAYVLMPGGNGLMSPHESFGRLYFKLAANFLIRSRDLFADEVTVVASTDATRDPDRMQSIIKDLKKRYPKIEIYLVGTSRGTYATMQLGDKLDGQVAGFIHTSSMNEIRDYDTRRFVSRHLIVHHQQDACALTTYESALANHQSFGTSFIPIEGGASYGDVCQAYGFHGYNNIEASVVNQIKAWVKAGK